jgi:hypothetical protein
MTTDELIVGLPGEDLIRAGLADIQSDRWTIPALLVAVAWGRFLRAGLIPPNTPPPQPEPELQLYRLLRRENGDAYSRYNALLRELISFEAALDRRMRAGAAA